MKKSIKRVLYAVLAMVLALSLGAFVACGTTESASTGSTSTITGDGVAVSNLADPATLNILQTKIIVDGFEWGPAVDGLLFRVNGQVDPASLSASKFTVRNGNTNLNVIDAYTCEEHGVRTDVASEYFAIKYSVRSNQLSPFSYNGMNVWSNGSMSFTASLRSGNTIRMGNTDYGTFNFNGSISISNRVIPSTDLLRKGTYTGTSPELGQVTLTYGAYETEAMANDGVKNPLIIWLHGAGEGGTNIEIALLGNDVTNLMEPAIQNKFINNAVKGAYVLAFQTPTMWMNSGNGGYTYNGYSTYLNVLFAGIRNYAENINTDVDLNRIYVGGCSNGGYMTMNLLINHGDYFAAAYPVCEAYSNSWINNQQIQALAGRKIWFTHSANDTTVNPSSATNAIYVRLLQAGAQDVYYSYFSDIRGTDDPNGYYMGHFSWIYTLQDQCTKTQSTSITNANQLAPTNNGGGTYNVTVNGQAVTLFGWLAAQSKNGQIPDGPVNPDPEPSGDVLFTLEAEDAYVSGVSTPSWWNWVHPNEPFTVVETNKPAASNNACIGSLNNVGATVTFVFNAQTAGSAQLDLYMSSNAGSGTSATVFTTSIFTAAINGQNLNFAAQEVAGGTDYSTNFEAVTLGTVDYNAGINYVVITVADATNIGNIDCLKVLAVETEPLFTLEAEDAYVSGVSTPSWWSWVHPNEPFTVVETNKPAASNNACIGSLNNVGATVTFVFNAQTAGSARLDLYMSSNANSGTGATVFSTSIFTASFNGQNLNFAAQEVAGGTDYSTNFEAVTLGTVNYNAGINYLTITVVDATNIGNIDCLQVIG